VKAGLGEKSREAVREELLASLNFVLPPREAGKGYGWSVGLLAAGLVVSLVMFAVFLGFLGWLAAFHTVSAVTSLGKGPYFLFHGPMAVLAVVLLVFLLKPFFRRRKAWGDASIELKRENEPFLFEFVEKLAKAVGAPAPARIVVDCEANAMASFDGGVLGLLQRRMTLTLGLPIVAALNVRQLAGVMGHEFGHFSQCTGMTASYLIRRFNIVLGRMVGERDRLDGALRRLRRSGHPLFAVVYWVAVAFIEPTRGILWLLLVAGDFLTCHTLRRMEHDADSVEAAVVGSADFAATDLAVSFLSISSGRARDYLNGCLETGRLADDYPRLVVLDAKTLRGRFPNIVKELSETATGPFDTHPSHADRAGFVEELKEAGRLKSSAKGSVLFNDFDALCRGASRVLYRFHLKEALEKKTLVPTKVIAEEWHGQAQGFDRLHQFFRGYAATERPLFPDSDARHAPEDVKEAAKALVSARNALVKAAEGLTPKIRAAREAAIEVVVGRARMALADIFQRSPQAHGVRRSGQRQINKGQRTLMEVRPEMSPFEHAVQTRLTLGLQLMQVPKMAAKLEDGGAAAGTLKQFLPICEALREIEPAVREARDDALTLRVLCANYNPSQPYRPLVDRILSLSGSLLERVDSIREQLPQAYPFEHAVEKISIGESLVDVVPARDDPGAVVACVSTLYDRYGTVTFRVLSKLAEVAGKLEAAVGLPALPEAPDRDPQEEEEAKKARRRAAAAGWAAYGGRAAAGVVLMFTLLWWSLNPPTLAWGRGGEAYRPAAFTTSVQSYSTYRPVPVMPAFGEGFGEGRLRGRIGSGEGRPAIGGMHGAGMGGGGMGGAGMGDHGNGFGRAAAPEIPSGARAMPGIPNMPAPQHVSPAMPEMPGASHAQPRMAGQMPTSPRPAYTPPQMPTAPRPAYTPPKMPEMPRAQPIPQPARPQMPQMPQMPRMSPPSMPQMPSHPQFTPPPMPSMPGRAGR
jgi:Zn-dependent protease with chaperone function